MQNILALTNRISRQFIRDKRTLALLIVAPILILTLVWVVFGAKTDEPKLAVVGDSKLPMVKQFTLQDIKSLNLKQAKSELKNQEIDAYIEIKEPLSVHLEGSDPPTNQRALKKIQDTLGQAQNQGQQKLSIHYLYGNKDMKMFDSFGPVLLGLFVFFFIFLLSGVSFLRERTTGTLDRLMASPIKNIEIILGYLSGFGLFAMIQSIILTFYSIYVLQMNIEGSIFYVLLTIFILSLSALTLGMLLSTFARNELQIVQFIPIVIVPQIFFSGLFKLDNLPLWGQIIGKFTPLYYAADALKDIMIRGAQFSDWWGDLALLLGFSLLFIILHMVTLRSYRKA
ncbi:ABC transporter permease subunit [Terrilactibacillus sp. BCM23-1]|uniref:ABC transporter permease subunit n=1 Tax=Terrilactibacillus tamarindi TaxID=2599694 RepID=A0A6N8CNZ4_9BACI|nr:ABC transporter permease [Terrilactibacillus tamarindi]MTT30867.1 ABC transporter permease subunit [Terrilactibacillus tamarindi]